MSKEIYNEFFRKHGSNVHVDPERFNAIAKLCRGAVLDIGCGTGDLADFYKGEYAGVDVSDVAVQMAEDTKRKNANFRCADVLIPSFVLVGRFDTIVMAEFLEHIEDEKSLMENLLAKSKPNTRWIISVPNGDRVPDPNHLREFTVPELRKRFSDYGLVRFHNWPGFEARILMSVDLGKAEEDDMSLVMIAKNEGKGLEKAILSAIEIVDNIVVSVDSLSKDNSLQIAQRYADVVKIHDWEDDFSKARNFAQEGVKTKWVLCLDGHEYVEATGDIRKMLALDVEGLLVKVRMDGGDTHPSYRIFRSDKVWNHAIHNAIAFKVSKKFTEFLVVHDRKGGMALQYWKERKDQVRRTMEKELKKELKIKAYVPRALFYLARTYRSQNQWKKSIKYYKKYITKGKHDGERWLCAYEAGVLCNALGKHLKALRFFQMAEKIIPNRWEISKHIGLTYMCFEHWNKALSYLVDSFKINEGEFSMNPEEVDVADTWDKIGYAFFQLKKYNKAKVAWEEAIKNEDNEHKIKLNKKRIELIDRKLIL